MWQNTIAKVVAWVGGGLPPYIDNSLPGDQPGIDNSLPGDQPIIDNSLPQPPLGTWGGARPPYIDNSLPPAQADGIWGGYRPPYIDNSLPPGYYPPVPHPGSKPRGYPVKKVVQMGDNPPAGGPSPMGRWIIINAGKDVAPAFAWLSADLPFAATGVAPAGGHWVPVDMAAPKSLEYQPATWVWVSEIGPNFGKPAQGEPKAK